MFVGLNDSYMECVSDRLLYVVDTDIHHVEGWGSFAENFADNTRYNNDTEAEFREERIQWGKRAAKYANSSWKWS